MLYMMHVLLHSVQRKLSWEYPQHPSFLVLHIQYASWSASYKDHRGRLHLNTTDSSDLLDPMWRINHNASFKFNSVIFNKSFTGIQYILNTW